MKQISKLTKQRFEKQNKNLKKLVKSHFDYNEIISFLNQYDIEQIVIDSYDDENNLELCTWQDCNFVDNWASTQEKLNENFLYVIKLINKIVKHNNVNIDDYFYTYKDKYQMVLYFPLRLFKNNHFDDYTFVLTNKKPLCNNQTL